MSDELLHRKDLRTAVVLGATGLVGGELLDALLQYSVYGRIAEAGRRSSGKKHDKLEYRQVDFEQEASLRDALQGQDIFCALGTTHAKAGSNEAFRKVDFTYVVKAAEAGLQNGAQQFLLVSSVGADAGSLFHYTRVKGETEKAVQALPFRSVHIFRPGILLGERRESRWGESTGKWVNENLSFLFAGGLSKYKGIEAKTVAAAMIRAALGDQPGRFVYENDGIRQLAERDAESGLI